MGNKNQRVQAEKILSLSIERNIYNLKIARKRAVMFFFQMTTAAGFDSLRQNKWYV